MGWQCPRVTPTWVLSRAALVLSGALRLAESRYAAGARDAAALSNEMSALIESEPRAVLDYAAVVDAESLEPLATVADQAVALVAARVTVAGRAGALGGGRGGAARLIGSGRLGARPARDRRGRA